MDNTNTTKNPMDRRAFRDALVKGMGSRVVSFPQWNDRKTAVQVETNGTDLFVSLYHPRWESPEIRIGAGTDLDAAIKPTLQALKGLAGICALQIKMYDKATR